MGEFGWIYSDTNKQIMLREKSDTYLLVPKPFQEKYGKAIYEDCYEGYGEFGNYDVFDLIPEWNRGMIPEIIRRIKNGTWGNVANDREIANLQAYYEGKNIDCPLRFLGILMAGEDKDNSSLEYPIKITTKEMEYENATPSINVPDYDWESFDVF